MGQLLNGPHGSGFQGNSKGVRRGTTGGACAPPGGLSADKETYQVSPMVGPLRPEYKKFNIIAKGNSMDGQEFKKIRKKKGLSQSKAAEEIGVTIWAVQSWERQTGQGKRPVPPYAVKAIERIPNNWKEINLSKKAKTAARKKATKEAIKWD